MLCRRRINPARKELKMKSFFLILFLSLIFTVFATPSNVDKKYLPLSNAEEKSILNGNIVIEALSNYYSLNNCYPEDLSQLLPMYISEIPETFFRENFFWSKHAKFSYTRTSNNSFFLSVRYSIFDEWYYDFNEKLWKWQNH